MLQRVSLVKAQGHLTYSDEPLGDGRLRDELDDAAGCAVDDGDSVHTAVAKKLKNLEEGSWRVRGDRRHINLHQGG